MIRHLILIKPPPQKKIVRHRGSFLISSSCRAIGTDIPDPFSPHLPIVHCFRQILRSTSCIGTELLYVGSSWTSRLCSSMWRGPQEYITYELVPTSSAVSGSSMIVFVMGGRWPYSCWFVGCCLQDLFNIARSNTMTEKNIKCYLIIFISWLQSCFEGIWFLGFVCKDNFTKSYYYSGVEFL